MTEDTTQNEAGANQAGINEEKPNNEKSGGGQGFLGKPFIEQLKLLAVFGLAEMMPMVVK